MPLETSIAASMGSGHVKPNARRKVWDTARMAICHINSVLADSVFVMLQTATVTLPYMTALASANSAPTWRESAARLDTMRRQRNTHNNAVNDGRTSRSTSQKT